MKKLILCLLTVGLVSGLVGLVYAGDTAEITVTATVGTVASITPGTTTYAFGSGLLFNATYQASTPLIFENDGNGPETFAVTRTGQDTWTFDEGATMATAPAGNDNAKIGGNWGASAIPPTTMTIITTSGGCDEAAIAISGSANLWLGLWTPAQLSGSSAASGTATLTVTATMD